MIEVKGLTKEFNGVTALNGVSFQVNEGEVFAYLGPNGAGKTTTVNILATLLTPTWALSKPHRL
jgi:ABC-2 type transport system ATP-binding protein